MGSWSAKLFDDDLALDLKGDWHDLYAAFGAPEQASEAFIREHASSATDEDTAATFWLTLATLQHRYGCLLDDVKARALEVLDNGEGLDEWKDQGDKALKARLREYEKVRKEITGPAKPRKKVKRAKVENTTLQSGQLIRYTTVGGRGFLLLVAKQYMFKGSMLPACIVFHWPHAEDPTQAQLDTLWPLASENEHFNFKFFRKRLATHAGDEGTHEFHKALGGTVLYGGLAIRGANLPQYPYDRIRLLPGIWTYSPPGHTSGPGIPYWHELDESLNGMSELHPDKPPIEPSTDALRTYLRANCPDDALQAVAKLGPTRGADAVFSEFKRALAKGGAGKEKIEGASPAAEACCRKQIADLDADPWPLLFSAWWLGTYCSTPKDILHRTDKEALMDLRRLLAALVIPCAKLGTPAAVAALGLAHLLAPPEPPEGQIPPPPEPFVPAIATLERIERLGVTNYVEQQIYGLRYHLEHDESGEED